ncbi:unnamed protein product [Didymodactylos carnosus]|uniref:NAD(P)(+)--arginine ADP-ribosyltransferase n=1 Tax=Didymodactylos carnosus TaxID=1234261 RepID=A0A8S2D7Y6_9BILA|nr:unnamed protein product [Didymodactylos carnosus]CAF3613056.1 unnamed protein product [Didymodactylos carnosus]
MGSGGHIWRLSVARKIANYLKLTKMVCQCYISVISTESRDILTSWLITSIIEDQKVRNAVEQSAPLSVYNVKVESTHKNLKDENIEFAWFQLFVETLIAIPRSSTEKDELLNIFETYYAGNSVEEDIIEEFKQTYKPTKAFWWYTKHCCLYKLLNKALRIQNMDILYPYAFFISDMYKLLKSEHIRYLSLLKQRDETTLHVYRGQVVPERELTRIRESFTKETINDHLMQRIEIDTSIEITKPFCDISYFSCFPVEQEVLFMLGSIFRIDNVIFNENEEVWHLKLTLCDENDNDMKDLVRYMQRDLENPGDLLLKLGEYDKAEIYYNRTMRELKQNDPAISICYHGLGVIAQEKGDYQTAVDYHQKALNIRQEHYPADDLRIGYSYYHLGNVFRQTMEHEMAITYYKKALKLMSDSIVPVHADIALVYKNIGYLQLNKGQYDVALGSFKQSLIIEQKYLPPNHSNIGMSYMAIAKLYHRKEEDKLALQYFNSALSVFKQTLPPTHPYISSTENYIRDTNKRNESEEIITSYL